MILVLGQVEVQQSCWWVTEVSFLHMGNSLYSTFLVWTIRHVKFIISRESMTKLLHYSMGEQPISTQIRSTEQMGGRKKKSHSKKKVIRPMQKRTYILTPNGLTMLIWVLEALITPLEFHLDLYFKKFISAISWVAKKSLKTFSGHFLKK